MTMIYKPTTTMNELKKMNKRKNVYFQTGVFGSDDSEIVKIAAIHEFGGEIKVKKNRYVPVLGVTLKAGTIITMPSRKWLTITFERNRETIDRIIKANLKKIAEGKLTVEGSNEIIAVALSSLTKKEMGNGVTKPKHREGQPMVDTGRLRQSIGTKVDYKGKTKGYGEG
ncbi:MAG: hypothetical protein ACRDCE_15710 [Cetobacterium sp.]|uniref:hypothetical protein n=1 Tax=Cetobacterium sp. TaxID=2071632 RepID=UPI003EE59B5B